MDEFKRRFSAAKACRKGRFEDDAREAYMFCFNGRESEWDDTVRANDAEPEEIFTDAVASVAEDFAGELFDTLTPENMPWIEFEAGNPTEADQAQAAEGELTEFETRLTRSVRASNYYTEGMTAMLDACIGNVAMRIDRPSLSSPIVCEAVPIPSLFLRLGPRGIDDRFVRERFYYYDLPALFPNASWDREMARKIKDATHGQAKVVTGYWRDWSDPANPIWLKRIRVDDKDIGMDETLGEDGSCELVVGRFGAIPKSPWGRGPAIRILRTLRVLDELTRMNLEGMERQIDPAYIYTHDGMLNLSEGIENGLGYPAMPESTAQPLGLAGNLDYGFFSEEQIKEAVRDAFYREVTQKGKTPPSATQYFGDQQKPIRRMVRPGKKTWDEFGVGVLKRFEYLERQPGGALHDLGDLPLIGSTRIIPRPISPLERAQAREEVMTAHTILGMVSEALGPQQAALLVDGVKTGRNIKDKLRDTLVEFRTNDEIAKIIQLTQGQPSAQPA